MKIAKASWRKNTVVRIVTETQKDYRWWRYQDAEPEEGYVEDTYTYMVPAYPRPEKPKTRKEPRRSLSRTRLRERLYAAGFRGEGLKVAFAEIVGFEARNISAAIEGDVTALSVMQGERFPFGWTRKAIRERFEYRGWKAVTKGIQGIFLVLDEFWYFASPRLSDLVNQARSFSKHNAVSVSAVNDPRLLPVPVMKADAR